jgi:hypothetical protein
VPRSAPLARRESWRLLPSHRHSGSTSRASSRLSISAKYDDGVDEGEDGEGPFDAEFDETVRQRLSGTPLTAPITRPSSALAHAIHSPKLASRPASVVLACTAARDVLPKRLSTAPPATPVTRPSSALSHSPRSPVGALTAPASRSASPLSHRLSVSGSGSGSGSGSPRSPGPLSMASVAPRPTLMFAIASDDAGAVRAVLAGGRVGANDQIGPQSALAFALTARGLANRAEIVKTLLEYGADPASVADPAREGSGGAGAAANPILDGLDPATRYVLSRGRHGGAAG